MSFGDISASRGNQRGMDSGNDGRDIVAQLRNSLAQFQVKQSSFGMVVVNLIIILLFQRSCQLLKDKVTELRRKKVYQQEKNQYVE